MRLAAAQRPLAAVGGWWDREPPRLKRIVRPTENKHDASKVSGLGLAHLSLVLSRVSP
jgi:hypothetical protein